MTSQIMYAREIRIFVQKWHPVIELIRMSSRSFYEESQDLWIPVQRPTDTQWSPFLTNTDKTANTMRQGSGWLKATKIVELNTNRFERKSLFVDSITMDGHAWVRSTLKKTSSFILIVESIRLHIFMKRVSLIWNLLRTSQRLIQLFEFIHRHCSATVHPLRFGGMDGG